MHTFLPQTAEYALRVMAWISARYPSEPTLARELSQGTQIPEQYLAKVLRRLVLAGILVSRKGRGGGFTLARPPREIRFREVLEAVHAYPQEGRCAFGWGDCDGANPCPLHESWSAMSDGFHRWAATATFARVQAAEATRRGRTAGRATRRGSVAGERVARTRPRARVRTASSP